MQHHAYLVLPHQLFAKLPSLQKNQIIFLVEAERYFTDFAFHKQKLMLHRASMRAYHDTLVKTGHRVNYIEYHDASRFFTILAEHHVHILDYIDPVDHDLEAQIHKHAAHQAITLIKHETPMFLCSREYIEQEFGNKKSFLMHSFYVKQRKRLNVLITNAGKPLGGRWSFDDQNRKRLTHSTPLPTITHPRTNAYVHEARTYVEKHFPSNPGMTDQFWYPVTYRAAQKNFDLFLRTRLKHFGTYQDAILAHENVLFHSLLSPSLNIGLLTPEYVLKKTLAYAHNHKIAINNTEGFIRQIIGWREFVRGVYVRIGSHQKKSNFWQHTKKISASWYDASTGITPIDTTITKVLKTAYAHHIERLMVLGNFMLLSGFSPHEVYRWFMELFIDSYDWVMVPNVYGMSQYADGGLMTTKPYISGASYVLKMSDYPRGEWCTIWNALFWHFIAVHQKKLARIPRLGMIYATLKKIDSATLCEYQTLAQKYLQ